MSVPGELVVIQAGYFSNFIGSHWWNMQESSFCYNFDSATHLDINHDVLFREGENMQREVTYTPRLVLIDLKSNLNSIRRESPLYQCPLEDEKALLWEGPVDVIKESPVRKNPFLEESSNTLEKMDLTQSESMYNFDSHETQWSDYLKTNIHQKSFCLFSEVSSSEDQTPLDVYSSGDEIYEKSGKDMIEEAVRQMTEECDHLQGFNLIFDAHNGFSSVCKHVSEHLNDEYSHNPSLCFPVFQDHKSIDLEDNRKHMHRLFAVLSSLSNLNNFNTCFSPLSLCDDVVKHIGPFRKFPYLKYKENSLYQSSAILAAAIEVLTSQCRLKSMKFSLSDVTSMMSMYGRKLTCSSICLPFPLPEDSYLSSMMENKLEDYFPTSLSPFYNPSSEKTLLQSAVLRGVHSEKFQRPNKSLHYLKEPEEIFGEYLKTYSASSVMTATVFSEKCSVSAPFPKFFKNVVSKNGFLSFTSNSTSVEKVPVAAAFNSSNSAGKFLEDILSQTSKPTFREYVKKYESCFEKDEFGELHESLFSLQENYQEC